MKDLGLAEKNPGVYYGGKWHEGTGQDYSCVTPSTNKHISSVRMGSSSDFDACVDSMQAEKKKWMDMPAPVRGEIVR